MSVFFVSVFVMYTALQSSVVPHSLRSRHVARVSRTFIGRRRQAEVRRLSAARIDCLIT